MKHEGLHLQRFSDNPMEKAFHDAWLAENSGDRTDLLAYLLGDGVKSVEVSDRDARVAATVIQWLGSEVGQHFLCAVTAQSNTA